jgi:hypothetical protein
MPDRPDPHEEADLQMNPASETAPPSAKSAGESSKTAQGAPADWSEALRTLIAARLSLIQLESQDAVKSAVRRIVCLAGLATCAFLTWILLVAGAIGAIAKFAGWPWYWVAMGAAAFHALAAWLFANSAKSSTTPSFPLTRAEFQKDREWIENLKNSGKSND